MRCGTPLIVTRSHRAVRNGGGHNDDKGVVFIDGVDSARMAIELVDI